MYFLMPRAPRVSLRATFSRAIARTALRIADAASEFTAPAPQLPAQPVEQSEADTTDFYSAADMPAVEDIEAAAGVYFRAAEAARAADRQKRSAKKVLSRLAAGVYGGWRVEREPSGRSTVDLEAVRATYKRLNLGELPTKSSAPTLKVSRVQLSVPASEVSAEFAALAGV